MLEVIIYLSIGMEVHYNNVVMKAIWLIALLQYYYLPKISYITNLQRQLCVYSSNFCSQLS